MNQMRPSAFVSLAACVLLAACSATAAAPSPAPIDRPIAEPQRCPSECRPAVPDAYAAGDARADRDRRPARAERHPASSLLSYARVVANDLRVRAEPDDQSLVRQPSLPNGCSSSWSTVRFTHRATTGTKSSQRSWKSRPASTRSAGSPAPTRTGAMAGARHARVPAAAVEPPRRCHAQPGRRDVSSRSPASATRRSGSGPDWLPRAPSAASSCHTR